MIYKALGYFVIAILVAWVIAGEAINIHDRIECHEKGYSYVDRQCTNIKLQGK
jgi:hypothetical protein